MNIRPSFFLGFAAVALLATASPLAAQGDNEALAKRGRTLFGNRGCATCHGIGKKMAAPDLAGLSSRRSKEWIVKFLKDTNAMLASDSTAIAMIAEWKGARMPQVNLTDADIDAILAHISAEEAKKK